MMLIEHEPSVPSTIYRGVTLPVEEITDDFFQKDILPHSEPQVDAWGRKTDATGNEYGVYMSDNRHMIDAAYAQANRGPMLPDSPTFSLYGYGRDTIWTPQAEIIYAINPSDTDTHRPFISSMMKGIYNNGFEGDEWVASVIPATNYKINTLRLGADVLHSTVSFILSDKSSSEALAELRTEYAKRVAKLAIASKVLSEMSPGTRNFTPYVQEALADVSIAEKS